MSSGVAHYLDRHGVEATTHFFRTGAGSAVVLIHGVGMNAAVWVPQAQALSCRFDVITYDTLGHGGSSVPPADVGLEDYAHQLRALLDTLGVKKTAVVGHSMGALIALEFALSCPERVSHVVAMNAVFRRTPDQKKAILDRVQALDSARQDVDSAGSIARWFGDPVPTHLRASADKVRDMIADLDVVSYRRAYRLFAVSDEAHADRVNQLTVPALFFTGEDDPHSTPEMSRAMAELAPKGRAEILPGERHMMAITAPHEVNARLLTFLVAPGET